MKLHTRIVLTQNYIIIICFHYESDPTLFLLILLLNIKVNKGHASSLKCHIKFVSNFHQIIEQYG